MEEKYEGLKLDRQLCFPLYVCGKEITRLYQPVLKEIDLTYTQYVTMMVVWEEKKILFKELGKKLFLDSGTLTPLLKKLEAKGLIVKEKDENDDRNVYIRVTEEGLALREKALTIPKQIASCVSLSMEETKELYTILHRIMGRFQENA